jgi:hypothetical protein
MAPAIEAVTLLSPLQAGSGNAARFPARARRCPVDRQVREHRRPAPDPAGVKRPPGRGGRLAPGRSRCERGDMAGAMAPAISAVKLFSLVGGGRRKGTAFARPCGTLPKSWCNPHLERPSARPGGPGALAPVGRVLHAQRRAGAMAPARPRGAPRREGSPLSVQSADAADAFAAA